VLGWTAVTGGVDAHALLLFLIIFTWTPPHFWALAIARKDEYAKVDIPMMPVTHGVAFTRLQILLYTILLFVVTLLPYLTGMSGLIYLAAAVGLGSVFLYYAIAMMVSSRPELPMKTFTYSITYLAGLFGVADPKVAASIRESVHIIREHDSVLYFVNTRDNAEGLSA